MQSRREIMMTSGRDDPAKRRKTRDDAPPPPDYVGIGGAAEWRCRIELANCYRIVAKLGAADWGWTHCVYNHITYKLPDACAEALELPQMKDRLFLINAFGCRFDEVTPESLHTIDDDGNIIRRGSAIDGCVDHGILLAGYMIHSAIHKARPDVRAIFHTHHPDCVAVCSLKSGLLPCSHEGCLALSLLSPTRHPYEGTATDESEKARIASALGPEAMSVILDNHGVVCCGHTLQAALRNIWIFTKAATYQVRMLSAAGGDTERLILVPDTIRSAVAEREMRQQSQPMGLIEYEAWLRGAAI